jgi:phosphoribosylformylglycinamidine synthase
MLHALRDDLAEEVVMLWHKEPELAGFSTDDCIILPGGFSYGDYLRCGALARFSPIMSAVTNFANEGGKVLGVCNGFQILCEAGLLPGVLLRNDNQKFHCKNVFLKGTSSPSIINEAVGERVLKIPVAHGEGRYHADPEDIVEMLANQQVVFHYCDEHGKITSESNPNGSAGSIAGICNKAKNVFGMMPHPERATNALLGNTDGQYILNALKHSVNLTQYEHA